MLRLPAEPDLRDRGTTLVRHGSFSDITSLSRRPRLALGMLRLLAEPDSWDQGSHSQPVCHVPSHTYTTAFYKRDDDFEVRTLWT